PVRGRGVDTLRLVGDCTNICVLYTAADARNLGYAVEVVRDGVTSFDEEAHRDALRELEKTLGATIVETTEIGAARARRMTALRSAVAGCTSGLSRSVRGAAGQAEGGGETSAE